MSKLTTKSNWVTDTNTVRLTMPFAKVDAETRQVSGYATLDNIDTQGDIVTSEASAKAFARARGNIREMHQPIAVGHIVDFREDEYLHDGKIYRGIYVTAYVSKGAEATWEKVLDGTLTGFSIGGEIKEAESQFVKDADATIRFIKDYELIELSLVDNPANPLANVFSIQKASDGSVTMKGMMMETKIENVFWCETDSIARTIDAESAECLICGSTMQNIGWVENGEGKTEKVKDIVAKFLSRGKDTNTVRDAEGEGGVDVSKTNKSNGANEQPEGEAVAGIDEGREAEPNSERATDAPEGGKDETLGVDGVNQETGEGAPISEPKEGEQVLGIDELPDEGEEISKKLDALRLAIDETLEKTRSETSEAVSALEKKVDGLGEMLDTKTSEFDKKFEELGTKLETAKSALSDFEKSLDEINSSEAIKKSVDLEKSAEPKQKETTWNGAFSVNNLLR